MTQDNDSIFHHFDTAFWKSFSQAGSVDFDSSFLLLVPVDPEDAVDEDEDEYELDHVEDEEEELVDELDPIVPSLLKLSGPQTDSTSWPVFHFSTIRLLGTAWQ